MASALHVSPLGPAIGALVTGIDLTQPLIPENRDALLQALLAHHVLFFENQPVTPVQQRELAAHFGPLHVHPVYPQAPGVPEIIVLDTDDNNPPDNDNWHTDITFTETPALGALLSAKLLPPSGGDTLWASGIAAFDALSPPYRRLLAGLRAEHDFLKSFPAHRFARTPEERVRWEAARDKHPPVLHPVIHAPGFGPPGPVCERRFHHAHHRTQRQRKRCGVAAAFCACGQARVHGALALESRRSGLLGQPADAALRHGGLPAAPAHHAPRHGAGRQAVLPRARLTR
jgi:alpha-ketoglutarate-dependent taurine dioxygenase